MLAKYFKSQSRVADIRSRPGGHLLEAFAQALSRSGYANGAGGNHLRAAEHFLYWSHRNNISFADFSGAIVERFATHLDSCECYGPRHVGQVGTLYGVQLFLDIGMCMERTASSALELEHGGRDLFLAFSQWMRQYRGSCELTLYNYGNSLRSFLNDIGDDLGKLEASQLRQFILNQSTKKGPKAAQRCTTALRMFIRFLIADGKCSSFLLDAIPTVAQWRLSSLPKYLQDDEVERIIASCNLELSVGKRDRAILLLLARLGLRAGDILRLRVSDIDWKEASIAVSGKGRRQTRMPLTQEVGQAIVAYLQQARPKISDDTLFIRTRAPFRAFANHSAISVIVERAMQRTGISCPSKGAAHLFRHSAATSMLRHGASLQDIAAVLRHRSIETTQIYAKVDIAALRDVAQSWPGEQPC